MSLAEAEGPATELRHGRWRNWRRTLHLSWVQWWHRERGRRSRECRCWLGLWGSLRRHDTRCCFSRWPENRCLFAHRTASSGTRGRPGDLLGCRFAGSCRRRRQEFFRHMGLFFSTGLNGLDGFDIRKPLMSPEIIGKFLNHLRPFSGVRSGLETRKTLISPTFR